MHQRVVVEQDRKLGQLLAIRQAAIDQKISGFFKGGLGGQLLHRNTAISQYALFPVHKGDGTRAAAGIGITGIKGDQASVGPQLRNINAPFPLGALDNRKFIFILTVNQFNRLCHRFVLFQLPSNIQKSFYLNLA